MERDAKVQITVQVSLNLSVDKVWTIWTTPSHIIHWNFASDDWHSPFAENDLQVGGKFNYRMESKDGKIGFDFDGVYTAIKHNELITYKLADGRLINIEFISKNSTTQIIETFEAESENSVDLQRNGWQAILDNFKGYAQICK